MKFILGVLTGVSLALIYHGDFHDSLLQRATQQWAEWQTIAARKSEQPASETNESFDAKPGAEETGVVAMRIEDSSEPEDTEHQTAVLDKTSEAPMIESDQIESAPAEEERNLEVLASEHPEPQPVLPQTPAETGYQVAWMPFHSETSASGFAEKLSTQLQRDLSIRKVAPGYYEVGFLYTSPLEQQATLDQIESITGYRAASGS